MTGPTIWFHGKEGAEPLTDEELDAFVEGIGQDYDGPVDPARLVAEIRRLRAPLQLRQAFLRSLGRPGQRMRYSVEFEIDDAGTAHEIGEARLEIIGGYR